MQAAADADQLAAIAQMPSDRFFPAHAAQPVEIRLHGFGTAQHDQVTRWQRVMRADNRKIDLRMKTQRIEIVMVRQTRISGRNDLESGAGLGQLTTR